MATDLAAPLVSDVERDLEAQAVEEEEDVAPIEVYKPWRKFGINMDQLIWKHRVFRMTYRPGYARSLLDRQYLRFWVLPAVTASVIIAEGYSKDWAHLKMVWENTLFLVLMGLAMVAPAVNHVSKWLYAEDSPDATDPVDDPDEKEAECCHIPNNYRDFIPDMCLAAAAFEHTRRGMYNLLEEADWGQKGSVSYAERGILCSEHLVMFWVVVLPLIAGRRFFVVAMYSVALAIMHWYTALPGLGSFCAGAILLVPVLIVEITHSGIYDELHRCSMGIKALAKGTGGGTCDVDSTTGRIVDASPELVAFWGGFSPGMLLLDLFHDPIDKEAISEATSFNMVPFLQEAGSYSEDDEWPTYPDPELISSNERWEAGRVGGHIGKTFHVTSMRCALTANEMVSARIVPIWKIPGALGPQQQLTKLWIEITTPATPNELAQREAALIESERKCAEREKLVADHQKYCEALEQTLHEMIAKTKEMQKQIAQPVERLDEKMTMDKNMQMMDEKMQTDERFKDSKAKDGTKTPESVLADESNSFRSAGSETGEAAVQ